MALVRVPEIVGLPTPASRATASIVVEAIWAGVAFRRYLTPA